MKGVRQQPSEIRWFFFLAGIIATLAYRVIIVLNFYSAFLVKVSWYIGTVGFILYFAYRYSIQTKRSHLAKDFNLLQAVKKSKDIKGDQKKALTYLVKSNLTSRSRWNSGFIFLMSVLALIVGILLDFGIIGFR